MTGVQSAQVLPALSISQVRVHLHLATASSYVCVQVGMTAVVVV